MKKFKFLLFTTVANGQFQCNCLSTICKDCNLTMYCENSTIVTDVCIQTVENQRNCQTNCPIRFHEYLFWTPNSCMESFCHVLVTCGQKTQRFVTGNSCVGPNDLSGCFYCSLNETPSSTVVPVEKSKTTEISTISIHVSTTTKLVSTIITIVEATTTSSNDPIRTSNAAIWLYIFIPILILLVCTILCCTYFACKPKILVVPEFDAEFTLLESVSIGDLKQDRMLYQRDSNATIPNFEQELVSETIKNECIKQPNTIRNSNWTGFEVTRSNHNVSVSVKETKLDSIKLPRNDTVPDPYMSPRKLKGFQKQTYRLKKGKRESNVLIIEQEQLEEEAIPPLFHITKNIPRYRLDPIQK